MTIDQIIAFDNYTFDEVKTLYDAIPHEHWITVVQSLPADLKSALQLYETLQPDYEDPFE